MPFWGRGAFISLWFTSFTFPPRYEELADVIADIGRYVSNVAFLPLLLRGLPLTSGWEQRSPGSTLPASQCTAGHRRRHTPRRTDRTDRGARSGPLHSISVRLLLCSQVRFGVALRRDVYRDAAARADIDRDLRIAARADRAGKRQDVPRRQLSGRPARRGQQGLRHHFGPFLTSFAASYRRAHGALCSTWWPCLLDAEWRLRSDRMTISRSSGQQDHPAGHRALRDRARRLFHRARRLRHPQCASGLGAIRPQLCCFPGAAAQKHVSAFARARGGGEGLLIPGCIRFCNGANVVLGLT